MSFWDTSFLWLEAVVASTCVAVMCAVVGVYAILRRVVFLPAALSQISGLGVVIAFALVGAFPALEGSALLAPAVVAMAVTLLAALLLGWLGEPRTLSREAVIGIAYITASALVIVIGDRIPQESHHIEDILFGNAVAVERSQMYSAVGTSVGVIAVHLALFRPFLMASFDPETGSAHGMPVRAVNAALFLSMGVAIAIATRTVGAMPVFAYSVLPAAAALVAFDNTRAIFVAAGIMGASSAFLGYWISFAWELPTGACTVVLAASFLVPARAFRALSRQIRSARV